MRNIVLVIPYLTAKTVAYVEALCTLEATRPALISSDLPEVLPPSWREQLRAFVTVKNCLDARQLSQAAHIIASKIGGVDRLFGVLEQVQLPIAQARDSAGIPGMGAEVVRRFRDKSAMKQVLRQAGVPCARYARLTGAEEARRFVAQVGFPVIIKPVDGLGTRATWRLDDREQLEAALQSLAPSQASPWQCEEFLVGTEHSFETVTINGRHVWSSSTNYIPGPLEAMRTPWIQYCVVLPREAEGMERFQAVNHGALNALGMTTGLSHMELFARPQGTVAVNEVGARPPGVNIMPLMSAAHGVDFVKAWVRLMALDEFEPPTRRRAAGSAFLRGQGAGDQVVAVEGLEEALADLGDKVVQVSPPKLGGPRASGYEGEGHIVVAAATTEEVMQALARIIRQVRVRLG